MPVTWMTTGMSSVMTRTDDMINVAGHRLSTGQIEEVLGAHDDVAECAVIGVADELKGQVPLGFLVLKAGTGRPDAEIVADVVKMVRERIGPINACRLALVALTMRTLTLRSRLLPKRWKRPVSSTRSSFTCPAKGRVPISSRNRVPPSAASNLPSARLAGAGVSAGIRAEQFGFDEIGRQRTAIQRDERAISHQRVRMHDLRIAFLACAIRSGDQHRQFRMRHLAGQRQRALTGRVCIHDAAQVVVLQQRVAPAAFSGLGLRQFAPAFAKLQQIVDGGDQLAVVPGFRQVIRSAGLHQVDRRFQPRPCGEQNHWQIGMARADLPEQCRAFIARGGVGVEVHVLDHQVHVLAR